LAALGFGLATALLWGILALTSARAAREDGPWTSLAAYLLFGALVSVPAAFATGLPAAPTSDWAWAAATGVVIVGASLCWLAAVSTGKVSLVTPIVATDGAIAALISIAIGERLGAGVGAALVVIVVGIVLVSLRGGVHIHGQASGRTVLLALGAGVMFGLTFVTGAQPEELNALWIVAVGRVVALVIALPIVISRGSSIRPSRAALPFIAVTGAFDVLGYAAFIQGSHTSLAVASVVASQYVVVAVLGGLLLFHERLTRLQTAGILLTIVGVTTLALVQAV
jgi:drug/metabolite transporter (DMT)-like permease